MATILLCLACALACSPSPRSRGIDSEAPARGERMALLPFDNLTDRPEASRAYTQILNDRIAGERVFDLAPMSDVERAMNDLRIRRTDRMDSMAVRGLCEALGVRYLLAGSVLDLRDGEPAGGTGAEVAATLRLIAPPDGRTIWSCIDARSGDDGEGPFGWGHTASGKKLAVESVDRVVVKLNNFLRH